MLIQQCGALYALYRYRLERELTEGFRELRSLTCEISRNQLIFKGLCVRQALSGIKRDPILIEHCEQTRVMRY